MLYQSGALGQELWRTRTATWKPERIHVTPDTATLELTAITDEGHPLIIEKVWHGELFVIDAVNGSF